LPGKGKPYNLIGAISAWGMMNPSLLFTASPGDVNPCAFSLYSLDTGSLLEPVTDFSLRLQVNGMRFIEK